MAAPASSSRREEFRAYMISARLRLLRQEVATAHEVRRLYARVAEQLRREVERIPGDTLQRRHLEVLRSAIEQRAAELRDELLRLSVMGIRVGAGLATEAAQQYMLDVAGDVFRAAGVRALFATVNEQAVLALLSRTLRDGLRLSDRVWRLADGVKAGITAVVEEAVAQGMDPRRAARLLHQYLRPGGYWAQPLRDETRRRMRVPRDVLHGALRLTVTEMHHAFHEAAAAAYNATPGVYGVEWRLSNAHVLPDVCDTLAAKGPYTPGSVPPKPHPWCRCYIVPLAEPPEQFVQRLRAWVADPASQPDIELWYRRYSEYLGGAIKAARAARRRPAAAQLSGPERFWQDASYRATLVRDLARAWRMGDQAALQAAKEEIDRAVVHILEREGLPRGPVADVVLSTPAKDPLLRGAAGLKHEDCRIFVNLDAADRILDGTLEPEVWIITWLHESLHARQPYAERWWREYSSRPGYEEGVVEGLARLLMHKLTGYKRSGQHPYDNYVYAMEGFARALGVTPEAMMRRLWQVPTGAVENEFNRIVEEHIGYQLLDSPWHALDEYYRLVHSAFENEAKHREPKPAQYWRRKMGRVLEALKQGKPRWMQS